MSRALLLVDIQNDFLPGGALAVPRGDEVVPVAARLMPRFVCTVATQDLHPPNHQSFAANHPGKKPGDVIDLDGVQQVLWPAHCVLGTPGSGFPRQLDMRKVRHIARKGTNPRFDSYSGFWDSGRRLSTGLHDWLKKTGVLEIWLMGLATDYCVRWTALDAVKLGYRVVLIEDGCRGIDVKPGDVDAALAEMEAAGVRRAKADDALVAV